MKPSETRPGSFGGRAPDVSIEAQTRFQFASDADHGRRLTVIYMRLSLLRNVVSVFRVGVIDGEIDPLLQSTKHLVLYRHLFRAFLWKDKRGNSS